MTVSRADHSALSVRHIFVSAGHSYFGRHGLGSEPWRVVETDVVECVAGRGLRGDRFFDHKENYKGQITLFSAEVFAEMRTALELPLASPAALRRNLIVEGVDLNTLVGRQFTLQGLVLEGTEECRPCYWMDEAIGPGAEAWLRGRGGLRCRILTDGWLRQCGIPDAALTGAVLAGGQSRRMGQDKARLRLGGEFLWQRQARVLQAAGAAVVGIVRQREQPALPVPEDLPVWYDTVIGMGPLAGLHAALAACPTGWLAVLATDMPRIDGDWYRRLARHCHPGCGAIVRHPNGHFEPLAAIYPVEARTEVEHRLHHGPHALHELVETLIARHQLAVLPLAADEQWRVANWNTPADVGEDPGSATGVLTSAS